MCSRNANEPPARRPARIWSIANRMAVCYALASGVVLFAATQILYWEMARSMHRDDFDSGRGVIQTIEMILRERGPDLRSLAVEVETESKVRDEQEYFARVLDADGGVVLETTGMSAALPPATNVVWPAATLNHPPVGQPWKPETGRNYLLLASAVRAGREYRIQLALDVSNTETVLKRHWQHTMLTLAGGSLAAALLGLVIVRLSMRPVKRITQAVEHITVAKLNERIARRDWPVELSGLARAFDEMLGRLEDSFSRLSHFSADLAHELRTPVTNLRGQTEVALTRSRSADEYRETLESNLEEMERLTRMIDSLLFLARAEHLPQPPACDDLDAAREIKTIVEFHEPLADELAITVAITGETKLRADSSLLRRAVGNLLMNALSHTPPHGCITVQLRQKPDAAEITVTDSGCGIPAEHLARVFDRFYRAPSAPTNADHGVGLGLAIVKSIMTLHGGRVTVVSEVGRGTSFTLSFPHAAAPRQMTNLSS